MDNPLEVISAMKDDLVAINPDMSFWAQRMMFVWSDSVIDLKVGNLA
jgi:hypothetical protein